MTIRKSNELENSIVRFILPAAFSFGIAVLLGLGGWNLVQQTNTNRDIAALRTLLESGKEQRLRYEERFDSQIKELIKRFDEMVTRREFEAQILAIKSELTALRAEVVKSQAQGVVTDGRLSEIKSAITNLEVRLGQLESKVIATTQK